MDDRMRLDAIDLNARLLFGGSTDSGIVCKQINIGN